MPTKLSIANYVVRIYRFQKDNPRSLVGVVEEVGVEGKRAFTTYDELWDILLLKALPPAGEAGWKNGSKKKDGKKEKGTLLLSVNIYLEPSPLSLI